MQRLFSSTREGGLLVSELVVWASDVNTLISLLLSTCSGRGLWAYALTLISATKTKPRRYYGSDWYGTDEGWQVVLLTPCHVIQTISIVKIIHK